MGDCNDILKREKADQPSLDSLRGYSDSGTREEVEQPLPDTLEGCSGSGTSKECDQPPPDNLGGCSDGGRVERLTSCRLVTRGSVATEE